MKNVMSKSVSNKHTRRKMHVIRNYEPLNTDDLDTRLRLVFAPWMSILYNEIESDNGKEVCDEKGRSDNSGFNDKTT